MCCLLSNSHCWVSYQQPMDHWNHLDRFRSCLYLLWWEILPLRSCYSWRWTYFHGCPCSRISSWTNECSWRKIICYCCLNCLLHLILLRCFVSSYLSWMVREKSKKNWWNHPRNRCWILPRISSLQLGLRLMVEQHYLLDSPCIRSCSCWWCWLMEIRQTHCCLFDSICWRICPC